MKSKYNKTNCASQLYSLRVKLGLSQQELGKKLGLSSGQYISNVENGLSLYSVPMMKGLAKATGIKPHLLVETFIRDKRDTLLNRLQK